MNAIATIHRPPLLLSRLDVERIEALLEQPASRGPNLAALQDELLRAEVVQPGWISDDAFLAGYGAAQAVPGPLFTFAAYLGAAMGPTPNGLAGGVIALVGVFLPGLLLVVGALPFWDALRARPRAQAAMRGANAAVVGILGAALYDPVWTSAVQTPRDFALALTAFVLLTVWSLPPWVVVVLTAFGGTVLGVLSAP